MELIFAISTLLSFCFLQPMCFAESLSLSNYNDPGSWNDGIAFAGDVARRNKRQVFSDTLFSEKIEKLKASDLLPSGEDFLTSLRYIHEIVLGDFGAEMAPNELEYLKINVNKFIKAMVSRLHDLYANVPDSPKHNVELVQSVVEKVNDSFDGYKKIIDLREKGRSAQIDTAELETFRQNYENSVKLNADKIEQILLDEEYMYYLRPNFITPSMNIATVCYMKMSQWQLLYNVFGVLNFVYELTYNIGDIMFSLVKKSGSENDETGGEELLETLRKDKSQYEVIYKHVIEKASREFWTCDPSKEMELETLESFTNYIVSEGSVSTASNLRDDNSPTCTIDNIRCPKITELKNCGHSSNELCHATRLCPGKLYNCERFGYTRYGHYGYAVVTRTESVRYDACVSKEKSNFARYQFIVKDDSQHGKPSCENGETRKIAGDYWASRQSDEPDHYCDTCKCTCEEATYYISRQWSLSSTYDNKVVVGAKLTVEDKTIFVQIQEGLLSANGTIDHDSVVWQPIDRSASALKRREPITWDGYREFALTKVDLPGDQIVTGLRLTRLTSKRIGLVVYGTRFSFRTGQLQSSAKPLANFPARGSNEYILQNNTKPSNDDKENIPRSRDDNYVKLTTTSLEKDGGQTTIPFIDVREVSPNPLTPLSGAQLTLRGQDGRDGILGLKLLSYNKEQLNEIESTIPDDIECPNDSLHGKKQMYETCSSSEECDSDKKLCCRTDDLGPKELKVCAYIRDASACVKRNVHHVDVNQCQRSFCHESDEQCCPGFACDYSKHECKFVSGFIENEVCKKDEDCESDLSCMEYDKCTKTSTCQSPNKSSSLIKSDETEPCYNRHCTTNEDCCAESVCKKFADGGRCRIRYNLDEGEPCAENEDCKKDLHCSKGNEKSTCIKSFSKKSNEKCATSKECDMPNGYCCVMRYDIRKHKDLGQVCVQYLKRFRSKCVGPLE